MLRMALAGLEMDLSTAAGLCGVGRSTLARLSKTQDAFDKATPATIRRIERGLERGGIQYRQGGWIRVIRKEKRLLGGSNEEIRRSR